MSEATFAVTFVTEHWIITWSDGLISQINAKTDAIARPDGSVEFGGYTLKWQNCTSPVVTSASELVTAICALHIGQLVTTRTGLDIAQGKVRGHTLESKFGRNPSIDTATTPEDIWPGGGTYPFLTSAAAIRVKAGGNIADVDGGAGAQTILVRGLDGDFNEISDTITLAGASASAATTNTYMRVSRAYVVTTGTYGGTNTADITIETTGAVVQAIIPAGSSQTQQLVYTIPAGYTGYLTHLHFSADTASNRRVSFELIKRENADDVTTPFTPSRSIQLWDGVQGHIDEDYHAEPYIFPAKTDVWLRITSVDQNGTAVTAGLDGYIVDNTYL